MVMVKIPAVNVDDITEGVAGGAVKAHANPKKNVKPGRVATTLPDAEIAVTVVILAVTTTAVWFAEMEDKVIVAPVMAPTDVIATRVPAEVESNTVPLAVVFRSTFVNAT